MKAGRNRENLFSKISEALPIFWNDSDSLVLRQIYLKAGYTLADAGTLTSVTLVALSAVTTALGWYQKLASKAGAGTLVPITGFANAVVSPAIEFRSEGLVTGVGAKMFIIAGPVIVYGMLASVVWGAIYWAIRPLLGG